MRDCAARPDDGLASAQPIQPRSSPGVVSWLARRAGRQTSGAARWAAGRRAIAGGDGATRITGGDGAPRIIGRRIGMAGATMQGRGRCRQWRCRERLRRRARLLFCSTLSYLRVELSRLNAQPAGDRGPVVAWERWGWGSMTPARQDGPRKAKPIKFPRARCGFREGSIRPIGLLESAKTRHCEPTGPAQSGRPDDRLREAIQCGGEDWIASSLRSSQ